MGKYRYIHRLPFAEFVMVIEAPTPGPEPVPGAKAALLSKVAMP